MVVLVKGNRGQRPLRRTTLPYVKSRVQIPPQPPKYYGFQYRFIWSIRPPVRWNYVVSVCKKKGSTPLWTAAAVSLRLTSMYWFDSSLGFHPSGEIGYTRNTANVLLQIQPETIFSVNKYNTKN